MTFWGALVIVIAVASLGLWFSIWSARYLRRLEKMRNGLAWLTAGDQAAIYTQAVHLLDKLCAMPKPHHADIFVLRTLIAEAYAAHQRSNGDVFDEAEARLFAKRLGDGVAKALHTKEPGYASENLPSLHFDAAAINAANVRAFYLLMGFEKHDRFLQRNAPRNHGRG